MLLRPMIRFDAPSSSYGTEAAEQHQQPPLIPGVGTNPLLIPMGIPSVPHGMMVSSPQEHYSSPKLDGMSALQEGRSSGAMSPFPPGKMNPDATAFAPTYMTSPGKYGL
jgi:hypothetical protein